MKNTYLLIVLFVWSTSMLVGCSESESTTPASCVVCISQEDENLAPYVDCGSADTSAFAESCQGSDGNTPMCESIPICCERAPLGSTGCPVEVPEETEVVPIINQSLSAVPGEGFGGGGFVNMLDLLNLSVMLDLLSMPILLDLPILAILLYLPII